MDQSPRSPQLFKQYSASTDATLIVRWGSRQDDFLDDQFARSAERLASTFRGAPADDSILLPWLYLYRHAMELTMKRSIHFAALLRRNNGDREPGLASSEVADSLKKKFGHRLVPLVAELDRHLTALQLPTVPPRTRRMVQLVGEVDPTGEALRYAGQLPDTTDQIDFVMLNDAVGEAYRNLSASIDMLSAYGDGQTDWLAERRQIEAEIEAEYRSDWF